MLGITQPVPLVHPEISPVVVTTPAALERHIEAAVERAISRLAPRLRPAERDRPSLRWMTNRETQKALGLSKATLARYRKDGTLPYSKVGSSVYYERAAVEELLSSRTVQTSA